MSDNSEILQFEQPILLVGPADMNFELFEELMHQGYAVIAADGGANRLQKINVMPQAIIGDLDSLEGRAYLETQTKVVHIKEQDSTDFEKCLCHIDAPLFLAFGFTGRRFDHSLATLHSMTKLGSIKNILLVGVEDISFVHSGDFILSTLPEKKVSIFPLQPICFSHSRGLAFPLDSLEFELGKLVGTSNCTNDSEFSIFPSKKHCDTPYLITLSIECLEMIISKSSEDHRDL